MSDVFNVSVREVGFHHATLPHDLTEGLDDVARAAGQHFQDVITAHEPEVTGAMKASTEVRPAGDLHYPIVIGVPYAERVNDETARQVPTHFVESAVAVAGPDLLARLDSYFVSKGATRR